jgi:hypothetical protein
VALSGLLATATLVLVENPVRNARSLRRSPRRSLLAGGGLTAAGICAAMVALLLAPATVGRGTAVAAPAVRVPARGVHAHPSGRTPDPRLERLRTLTAQVQGAVAASSEARAVPSNLRPPLADAQQDTATPFQVGCMRPFPATDVPPCVFGDPRGTATVALAGDSHAAAWFPAVDPLAQRRHWRLVVLSKAICPLLLDLPEDNPYLHRHYTECEQWRTAALARLAAARPALVMLAMSRRYTPNHGFAAYDRSWLAALRRTVTRLRALGSAVLVLGPVPDPRTWAPTCLSDHLDAATACAPSRSAAVNASGVAAEAAEVTAAGGHYADVTDLFCTATRCPLIVGNDLVYRDDNHVTVEYAALLRPVIEAEIALALPGG